jgi:hypothetical protein
MSTGNELQAAAVDLLTTMQSKAIERFELELSDLRTTMMTMATCCEQSLEASGRPVDFVRRRVRLVTDRPRLQRLNGAGVAPVADLEAEARARLRAACRTEIGAAKHELDSLRTQCEMEIAAAEGRLHYRDGGLYPRANAAHGSRLAKDAEASMREELNAMQARNQEIVDAQTLRLMELKRELERASAEADRARAAAELANREAVAKLAHRSVLERPRAVESQPRPV